MRDTKKKLPEFTKLIHLKPSLKTRSLRLPVSMIEDLKVQANRRDVPYQSLLKVFLAERLARDRQAEAEQVTLRS
jgi:hypothetical protein